ncbi:cell wall-binding repeat-containing protein, partial [Motilibacter deserti]
PTPTDPVPTSPVPTSPIPTNPTPTDPTPAAGPTVTADPVDLLVAAGSPAVFTAGATGFPTPLVTWQVSSDGGATWHPVLGAVSRTLVIVPGAGDPAKLYRAVFTNLHGTVASDPASLAVASAPGVSHHPDSASAVLGGTVTFVAGATGNPAPVVAWVVSRDGGQSWEPVADDDGVPGTLTVPATRAYDGAQFRAVFTNAAGAVMSDPATLDVHAPVVVTAAPQDRLTDAGSAVTFEVAATGDPEPTVQWEYATGDGGWLPVAGATGLALTVTAQQDWDGRRYRAVLTNAAGSVSSPAALLSVRTAPAVLAQPVGGTIDPAQSLTLTAAATGSPEPAVQWQQSRDGGTTWTDIPGATSSSVSVVPGTGRTAYRAVFTNVAGSTPTAAADVTVRPVAVVAQPADVSARPGSEVSFEADAITDEVLSTQWETSLDGDTWEDVAGATERKLTVMASGAARLYRARFTTTSGMVRSSAASLTVLAEPLPAVTPLPAPVPSVAVPVPVPAPAAAPAVQAPVPAATTPATGATQAPAPITGPAPAPTAGTSPAPVAPAPVAPAPVAPAPAGPATATPFKLGLSRVSGDPATVSAVASSASFAKGVPVAFVVGSKPDALVAGPAAARLGGPVLVTDASAIPGPVAAELARLAPKQIVIVGGTSVVTPAVETALKAYAVKGNVVRANGKDRFAAAASLSKQAFGKTAKTVYVVAGTSTEDALVGRVAAAAANAPLLYSNPQGVPPVTAQELKRLRPSTVVVVGSPAKVSAKALAAIKKAAKSRTVRRLTGKDAQDTSAAVATASAASRTVYLASGRTVYDALASGAGRGAMRGPLLLVTGKTLPKSVTSVLKRLRPTRIVVLGDASSLPAAVEAQAKKYLG